MTLDGVVDFVLSRTKVESGVDQGRWEKKAGVEVVNAS